MWIHGLCGQMDGQVWAEGIRVVGTMLCCSTPDIRVGGLAVAVPRFTGLVFRPD